MILDGPNVNCCRDKVVESSKRFWLLFCFSLIQRRRIEGIKRKMRNAVNVIIKMIQNAATIVFVKMRFSNIRWLIIFVDGVLVISLNFWSCFKIAVRNLLVVVLRVVVVVGARNIGIINDDGGGI